jgi:hypothetical protein
MNENRKKTFKELQVVFDLEEAKQLIQNKVRKFSARN